MKELLDIGEEVIGGDNLNRLLENKKNIVAYDGFEPSGRMHLAQGLLRAHNVNKFVDNGIKFKFWIADWFALMNLKLGGNIKKINQASELMVHIWRACGMKLDEKDENGENMIQFIKSSEEISKRSEEYWKLVLDISTRFNLNRIKKCTQIMGRKENDISEKLMKLKEKINSLEGCKDEINDIIDEMIKNNKEELAASQIFYPVMQCADIFFLGVDICSLGIDQRKVNALALEYCDKIKRKNKPIIISHHMLMGLNGEDKMSKSNPDSAIFMDDNDMEVKRKIKKAFCEPKNVEKNPVLDWIKWLVFPIKGKIILPENIKHEIPEKIYHNYQKLEEDFKNGNVFPTELKNSLTNIINDMLKPIRNYFDNNKEAKKLFNQVRKFK
jgi:tyrosyl-tRNA synthetase